MKLPSEIEICSVLITPLLAYASFSHRTNNLVVEFNIIILSQYLVLLFPIILPCFIVILCISTFYNYQLRKYNTQLETNLSFDIHRALLMIPVTISILMCDFPFWTQRFGKFNGPGLGFMDGGIGAFLFNSSKVQQLKRLKNSIFLILLGFIRLFTIKACKSQGIWISHELLFHPCHCKHPIQSFKQQI